MEIKCAVIDEGRWVYGAQPPSESVLPLLAGYGPLYASCGPGEDAGMPNQRPFPKAKGRCLEVLRNLTGMMLTERTRI